MAYQGDNPYIILARVTYSDERFFENKCFSTSSILPEAQVCSEH
jgi:hypothetical protein